MYLDGIFEMADILKKIFKKKSKDSKQLSKKDIATEKGEPYFEIIHYTFDRDKDGNITGYGNFELDWNDHMVARLIKAGWTGKTDVDIIDNYFTEVCRNVVLETYEQEQADPKNRSR